MLQIRTVLDWRFRRRVWQLLYHVLKPKHDNSSSVFSLVLRFGFSRLSKVHYTRFEYILGNFTAVKAVGASAIRTITKLLTVHKLWVEYFFVHRGHLFMILISESSCGRQNVSLITIFKDTLCLPQQLSLISIIKRCPLCAKKYSTQSLWTVNNFMSVWDGWCAYGF